MTFLDLYEVLEWADGGSAQMLWDDLRNNLPEQEVRTRPYNSICPNPLDESELESASLVQRGCGVGEGVLTISRWCGVGKQAASE